MNNQNNNSYLGAKGYTILKSDISVSLQNEIKDDLNIKPYVSQGEAKSYPVYRESFKKLYVPRYYGLNKLGPPKSNNIENGETINLEFNGTLREKQEVVVSTYMNYIENPDKQGGLLELPCAFGKTILSLNIISRVSKKTLIIVHKEFLMNQWIERIQEFLPTAKVGKIQGQIIDIDDKDIVIGMLQSLSMKEYPASIFEPFGLTIIDEVHHISSEVFSKSLFKIVTKHMLGLSATMNRKDGTTRVFKMFLGDVIYKGEHDEKRIATVRAIEYRSHDEEFEETALDFRGKPAFSTMISKICEYNRRSEFILKVLKNMLEENPKQQVMILAHNRNILTYFHDAIKHRNLATVGYYLGGMKEKALKETETKQIVIATYAMAAEALDIKTLTTLIMATSKTDIQQSVGRILREKHSNPIIVDIIDTHDIFKSQWNKRKAFYRKEDYKIFYTNSDSYDPDVSKWEPIEYKKRGKKSIQIDDDTEDKYKPIGVCLLKMKK
jgi:superfamily II DNA or RNA helicase